MRQINQKTLVIISLATLFGLASGIVGQIISRTYILGDDFNLPLFGEINFNENGSNGRTLVIQSPKKVVVEQNTKTQEIINGARESIVGIYARISTSSLEESEFKQTNFYQKKAPLASAFIITSDGWLISNFTPVALKKINTPTSTKISIYKSYQVITSDNEIYNIDDIVFDPASGSSFWHVLAEALPVRGFANYSEIQNGQLVVAVNWQGWSWISTIVDRKGVSAPLVKSSDRSYQELILQEKPLPEFNNSYLFSLNGNLTALIDDNGKIIPTSSFLSCINCLLEKKKITRAELGVIYVDLSEFVGLDNSYPDRGALIFPDQNGVAVKAGFAAEQAGLKRGDIITKVNNIQIDENNSLSDMMVQFSVGDKVTLEYMRGSETKIIEVELAVPQVID